MNLSISSGTASANIILSPKDQALNTYNQIMSGNSTSIDDYIKAPNEMVDIFVIAGAGQPKPAPKTAKPKEVPRKVKGT